MGGPGLLAVCGAALGLVPPWQVVAVSPDKRAGSLEIAIDLPHGSRFGCPGSGCANAFCPVRRTTEERLHDLGLFEHQASLVA